jgi:hypothetical protein
MIEEKLDKYLNEARKSKEFQEGDKVKITYGQYKGKTGTFVEYSPQGGFAIVKVSGKNISIDASDLSEQHLMESAKNFKSFSQGTKRLRGKLDSLLVLTTETTHDYDDISKLLDNLLDSVFSDAAALSAWKDVWASRR